MLQNKWEVNNEIKEEIKKYTETNDQKKHNHTNSWGCSKSSLIKEVHSDTSLPLKTRKSQIDNLTCHLKELDKEQINLKSSEGGRKWQPTPVFLPGKSQGRRSLVGLQSMGSQRVRHD